MLNDPPDSALSGVFLRAPQLPRGFGRIVELGLLALSLQAQPAKITSPLPGSVLPGTAVTFGWTAGVGANAYWLDVGNTQGQGDIYPACAATAPNCGVLTATSKTVSGIPCDGRQIWVRLWTKRADWQTPNDYKYTACSPGDVLPSGPVLKELDVLGILPVWTFATPRETISGVKIYRNGLRLGSIDYTLSPENRTATFREDEAPKQGDHLIVEYTRQ